LADERRSRRFRERDIDPLLFRVILALVGTFFLATAALGITRDTSDLGWMGWSIVTFLVALGAGSMYASFFGSRSNVEKWADASSTHMVAVLLILVAFPVAWAIRKVFPSDAT
jgi:hypothetical protein